MVADSNSSTASHAVVSLTKRDLDILSVVGENGLALLEQLWLMYWQPTGGKLRTCRERLAKLEHANYLSRHFLGVRGRRRGEIAFSLTKQGRKELSRMLWDYYQIGLPSSHELRQQIMALDARIVLTRQFATEGKIIMLWSSERVVRSEVMSSRLAQGGGWSASVAAGRKKKISLRAGEIPDARFLVVRKGSGGSSSLGKDEGKEEIDLELDGQYTGQTLVAKFKALARLKNRVIYAYYDDDGGSRTARLNAALEQTNEACSQKIELVGILYGPDPDDPYRVGRTN